MIKIRVFKESDLKIILLCVALYLLPLNVVQKTSRTLERVMNAVYICIKDMKHFEQLVVFSSFTY